MRTMTPAQFVAVLLCGTLFGFGLAWSTMIQPEVVLSFLRFEDWGLMLVMGGAIALTLPAYQLARRLLGGQPLLGGDFEVRQSRLDRPTLVGAAIFGIGWGLCGVCPAPAIAGLGVGNWDLLVALAGIAVGALLQGLTAKTPR